MSYLNPLNHLSPEAAEKAAHLVLTQLSERRKSVIENLKESIFNFAKDETRNEDEMECLQFGICAVPSNSHPSKRVIL